MTSRIASPSRWSASLTLLAALTVVLPGCSDDKKDGASTNSAGGSASTGGGTANPTAGKSSGTGGGGNKPIGSTGKSSAADIARKLGRDANFLIGMGNDAPKEGGWENAGIYTLGTQLDLHYVYLTNGWQNWNAGGYFAQIVAKADKTKGTTPMVTVYGMADAGENNFGALVDDKYMNTYWEGAKLLMTRYAEIDTPAVVHLEPDFWAYGERKSNDPTTVPAHLHPDCKDLPNNLSGMARCWIQLARDNAPKVVIGLHASEWGGDSAKDVGDYLNKLGAAESDILVIDMLDRDAGCFEDAKLMQCKRDGKFYLDETNKTSPNYAERLDFAKQVAAATGKPILWWQLPFGVPSDTPGGTPGHFRDNKVHYLFSHIQEFIDAGGLGATFGTGAGDQTFVTTDGGQFANAVKAYAAAPVALR